MDWIVTTLAGNQSRNRYNGYYLTAALAPFASLVPTAFHFFTNISTLRSRQYINVSIYIYIQHFISSPIYFIFLDIPRGEKRMMALFFRRGLQDALNGFIFGFYLDIKIRRDFCARVFVFLDLFLLLPF